MQEGKAFFVVGHRDAGKSQTLNALANGKRGWCTIGPRRFFVRRMSNDDRPRSFFEFIKRLKQEQKPHVIIALCPTFDDPKVGSALSRLRREYQLFFFVLEKNYKGKRDVSGGEIRRLKSFGKVRVLSQEKVDKKRRATEMWKFIKGNL